MCQGVGILGSACNIDTPIITESRLNLKIAIICIYLVNTNK